MPWDLEPNPEDTPEQAAERAADAAEWQAMLARADARIAEEAQQPKENL